MCGRYALAGDWSDFTTEFELDEVPAFEPRFNIAPSARGGFEAPILVKRGVLVPARFWYIPSWWSKPLKELPTSFNARSETAMSKPLFRGAGRCLIPTSGWREFPGPSGRKKAFSFERRHAGQPDKAAFFAFGGLWTEWQDREIGELVRSFAILTMEPSAAVKPYHHRMPLLVPTHSYADWLDADLRFEDVISAAESASQQSALHSYECSTYGNSTRVEGPGCIAPVLTQPALFD